MKRRNVICALCGEVFSTTGTTTKYCLACRKKSPHKIKPAEKEIDFHTCDTPENIAICLNCPYPECKDGECDLVRKKKGGTANV